MPGPESMDAESELPAGIPIDVQKRTSDFKLMFLRTQLFTAMQQLKGDELAEFWELIDDVEACRARFDGRIIGFRVGDKLYSPEDMIIVRQGPPVRTTPDSVPRETGNSEENTEVAMDRQFFADSINWTEPIPFQEKANWTEPIPFQEKAKRTEPIPFQEKAKRIVFAYAKAHLDKSDRHVAFSMDEVYVVWFVKALQNWKALVSTTLPDGMYYEVTYDGDIKISYLDVYKKFVNISIVDPE